MCDACSAKGINWSLANGPGKSRLEKAKLYSSFEGKEVNVKLCYLCNIKLFLAGERKFLQENRRLRSELAQQHGSDAFDF